MSAHIKFPYEIKDVDAYINKELLQYFHGERDGFVQVGPEKYFFPQSYRREAEAFYNFEARPSDVWVVTFPRSGTTWTQELVWLIANNLNFDEAQKRLLTERFPFFEFSLFVHPEVKQELLAANATDAVKREFIERISQPGYKTLSEVPHGQRRFIKTHFPFSLLPPSVMREKCKIIYVARNPKDVAISYYHLNRLYVTQGYSGDFERYWSYFERGLNPWLPYQSHVREAEQHRHCSNVLHLNYEDMKQNLFGAVQRVATFLDVHNLPAGNVQRLLQHLDIVNFRQNRAVNGNEMADVGVLNKGEANFVRNGHVGVGPSSKGMQKEFAQNLVLNERVNMWMAAACPSNDDNRIFER